MQRSTEVFEIHQPFKRAEFREKREEYKRLSWARAELAVPIKKYKTDENVEV
jgi:hypothetical protein